MNQPMPTQAMPDTLRDPASTHLQPSALNSKPKAQPSEGKFFEFLATSQAMPTAALQQLSQLLPERREPLLGLIRRTGLMPEQQALDAFVQYTQWTLLGKTELTALAKDHASSLKALRVNSPWCEGHGVIIWDNTETIYCATRDFLARPVSEWLRLTSGRLEKSVEVCAVSSADLASFYAQTKPQTGQALAHTGDLQHLRELAEEGPIIELINGALSQAVTHRASDIHIEPNRTHVFVRLRVDGVMRDLQTFALDRADAAVCRIKILSQLDIAERRLPQDGRMTARVHGETFDVRVSILPSASGESVVLRLLRQDRPTTNLADLGMRPDHAAQFEKWVRSPNGIVLVTGPTGSGKTTTLYTALDLGNDGLKKIITVEDPVEYQLEGITQLQVHADIGYTFASALRSILRHDPDVILIGEIRDPETASIAVQSSLTGHLVFSTLHTNTAIGAVTRLVDMGIEPFMLASSLKGVMAQRLVRRLCPHCSKPHEQPEPGLLKLFEALPTQSVTPRLRTATGCDACMHTGYKGRMAVYELIDIDESTRTLIASGVSEGQLAAAVAGRNIRSMTQDALLKAWEGETTIDEALSLV